MKKFMALLIPAVIVVVSIKGMEALPADQRRSNEASRASSSLDWLNPFTWFSGERRERRNNEEPRVSVIQQHSEYPQKIRRRLGVNDKLVFAAYEERPEDAKDHYAKAMFSTSVSSKQKATIMQGQEGGGECVCRCDCCDCCPCNEDLDYYYTE